MQTPEAQANTNFFFFINNWTTSTIRPSTTTRHSYSNQQLLPAIFNCHIPSCQLLTRLFQHSSKLAAFSGSSCCYQAISCGCHCQVYLLTPQQQVKSSDWVSLDLAFNHQPAAGRRTSGSRLRCHCYPGSTFRHSALSRQALFNFFAAIFFFFFAAPAAYRVSYCCYQFNQFVS